MFADVGQEGIEVSGIDVERLRGGPDVPGGSVTSAAGVCAAGPSRAGKVAVKTGNGRDRSGRARAVPRSPRRRRRARAGPRPGRQRPPGPPSPMPARPARPSGARR